MRDGLAGGAGNGVPGLGFLLRRGLQRAAHTAAVEAERAQRNEREATRFGLMGMRERVQALDGMFQIDNRPGEGVTVIAVIPAKAAAVATDDVEAA